mmetsp:Transcript_19713/g.59561  ORF Transcript_19713/g.59561 Transcript_19713/m.59561 type:complete len:809 (-) Transcript_19713:69-2495(-)
MDWDSLLQQSEDQAFQDGFPQMERDLMQVEQLSLKLRAKASRLDQSNEELAASRLLAQQGVNARRYNRDLLELELQPSHEDVFTEPTTVDEYLQQVHESTVVSAIQEAQRQTDDTFQQFMNDSLQAHWQQAKRRLLDSMLPSGGQGGFSPAAPLTVVGPAATAAQPDLQTAGRKVQLTGRFKGYADVTLQLNEAAVDGRPFDAVAAYTRAACSDQGADDGMSICTCWQLLQSITGVASGGTDGTADLLRGAQEYLERGHVAYMQRAIQAERAQAALGGNPSKLGQVHAFLRVKNQDVSTTLDFDSPTGTDTSWQRIFCCLRSGFSAEALEVAQSSAASTAGRPGGKDFAGHLSEWLRNGGRLPARSAAALAPEVERVLREGRDVRRRPPFWAHRAACHVLLAADRRLADQLQREVQGLFPTIEDYMWFQLVLVRAAPPEALGGDATAAAGVQAATLDGLQQYLQQYPPAHYSHQGKQPLLYSMVLLLSLQLRGHVAFLARDPSTRPYRVDAVHFALALHAAQLLDGPSDGCGGETMDVGAFVHLYAKEFVHTDVRLALEYYIAAARLQGDSRETRGRLLRELLTESQAYGFLLGSGGADGEAGALAAFVPERAARHELIAAIAEECAGAAQTEEAVELFMYAGQPRPALHMLSHQLSDLIEPSLDDAVAAERADAIELRGAAAVAALRGSIEREDVHQLESFAQLKVVRQLLQAHARGEGGTVAQLLMELPMVPLEAGRVAMCSANARTLHPALLDRLPKVLAAAAFALEQQRRQEALRAVVAFAEDLPSHVPTAVFQALNRALQSAS